MLRVKSCLSFLPTCPAEGGHGLHYSSPQIKHSSLRSVPHHSKLPWYIVHCQRVSGELVRDRNVDIRAGTVIFLIVLKDNILQNMLLSFSCLCPTFKAIDQNRLEKSSTFYWPRLISSDFVADLVLDFSDDVQIWQTWFHHQHISSFSHISLLQHRMIRSPATVHVCMWKPNVHTNTLLHINLPQLEWRVLLLQEAADSNVCPQTQVWTVQHLCIQTQWELFISKRHFTDQHLNLVRLLTWKDRNNKKQTLHCSWALKPGDAEQTLHFIRSESKIQNTITRT